MCRLQVRDRSPSYGLLSTRVMFPLVCSDCLPDWPLAGDGTRWLESFLMKEPESYPSLRGGGVGRAAGRSCLDIVLNKECCAHTLDDFANLRLLCPKHTSRLEVFQFPVMDLAVTQVSNCSMKWQ